MLKIRLEMVIAAFILVMGLAFAGCPPTDDDDADDDDDSTPADDDDDASDDDDATDDDDAVSDTLDTCDDTGDLTLGVSGDLTCSDDAPIAYDWFTIEVEAGDCVHIYADNDAGAADLLAVAVDPDLVAYYGLVADFSQLDDEAPCTTDAWNGFACPSASLTANTAGAFRVAIGQWGGEGCTEAAGYTIHFAVNGTTLLAAQTHDNTTVDAFFESPGDDDDDDDATDDDDSAVGDDDDDSAVGDDDDDSAVGDDDDDSALGDDDDSGR